MPPPCNWHARRDSRSTPRNSVRTLRDSPRIHQNSRTTHPTLVSPQEKNHFCLPGYVFGLRVYFWGIPFCFCSSAVVRGIFVLFTASVFFFAPCGGAEELLGDPQKRASFLLDPSDPENGNTPGTSQTTIFCSSSLQTSRTAFFCCFSGSLSTTFCIFLFAPRDGQMCVFLERREEPGQKSPGDSNHQIFATGSLHAPQNTHFTLCHVLPSDLPASQAILVVDPVSYTRWALLGCRFCKSPRCVVCTSEIAYRCANMREHCFLY